MKTPWMRWFPGDYIGATGDLTLEEHGAYSLLLNHMWCRGGKLPADHGRLARILGVGEQVFSRVWATIGRHFNAEDDGTITNRRVSEELRRANGRKEQAEKSAEKRWDSNAPAHAPALPTHMREQCSSNAISEVRDQKSDPEDPDPDRRLTPAVEDSLSLVPDEPEAAPKSKRVRKTELPAGFFNACLTDFCVGWSSLYGEKYVPQPDELGLMRSFLGRLPEEQRDQWGDRLARYFDDQTRYNVAERRHSLKFFVTGETWNKYAVSVVTWKTPRQQESENAAAQFIALTDARDLEAPPARKKIGGAS